MKKLLFALSLAVTGVSAQTLKDMKLDMAQARTGQNVTATVGLEAGDQVNCGMRVKWGDGAMTEIRVRDKTAIPYKATHAYTKPGDYQVVADPHKIKSSLPCIGKGITIALNVVAPPPPPIKAATSPTVMAKPLGRPSCPENWKLNPKSVVKKTGAYSCTARAGTATPDIKPTCPGDLTYYENSKKGMLGCRI